MKFRYDIGALRAFSVLVVLLFHFKVPFFSGGFLGVDIFFVISGFLMTKIILSGIKNNTFNFFEFYIKRYKRIVPALLFLLSFIILASVVLMLPQDIRLNCKYVFLSSIFSSNVYFWLYNDYFDAASQTNILLHSWSLSVEWQFYLLYPLLIWPLRKLYFNNKKKVIYIFTFFTFLSFLLMVFFTKEYNSFSFYMFPTRAWEMTMGGLATLIPFSFFEKLKISKNLTLVFCYTTLITCTVFINESMLWPSFITLIPVFAVFLILYLNTEFKILRNKLIQFIGDISYSLYLWHWPLYIIFNYYGFNSYASVLVLLLLSFGFAIVSYYIIENNLFFRNKRIITIYLIFVLLLSSLLFYKPLNPIVEKLSIFNSNILEQSQLLDDNNIERVKQFNSCGCFLSQNLKYANYNKEVCLTINDNKKNILLLGDSHAAQISLSLREKLPNNYHLLEASASYVFPLIETNGSKESKKLMEKVFKDFLEVNSEEIDLVIISAHWLMYKNNQLNYDKKTLLIELNKTLEFFKKKNLKVVLVGQTETYTISYPKIVALNEALRDKMDSNYINYEAHELNTLFKEKLKNFNYLDVYNHPDMIKHDLNSGKLYMFDNNHFSKYGADQLVEILLKKII